MQNSKTLQALPDQLGIWASILCVVHCIATPVLLSASAVFAHLLPGEEKTHRTLAIAIALFGAVALIHGFRTHRRIRILLLMAAGMLCIFVGAYVGDRLPTHLDEMLITALGSALMISAHRLNHTFCGRCQSCTVDPTSFVSSRMSKRR